MDRATGIFIALGAAAVAVAGFVTAQRLTARAGDARRAAQALVRDFQTAADTTSPQYSAIDQRYRQQRAAIEQMRADLLRLVAAESAYAADSGHPTPYLPASYFPALTDRTPYIRLTPNGWWARIESRHTAIWCAVVVGPDTVIGGAKSGEPVCQGWSAGL